VVLCVVLVLLKITVCGANDNELLCVKITLMYGAIIDYFVCGAVCVRLLCVVLCV
jgi:hypothetical protein